MKPAQHQPTAPRLRAPRIPGPFLILLAVLAAALRLTLQAQSQGRFDPEIAAFERSDLLNPPPKDPVLFTGSSSIRMWSGLPAAFPGLPVLNRGFGGSEMSDLLHYFDRVVARYRPAVLFVYEGDNDLNSGLAPATVALSFSNFLARIGNTLPDTHTVLLAIKPSPSRIHLLDAQRDLNARLRALAGVLPNVSFIDVFNPMLDASGVPRPELYLSDRLHMTTAGYDLWRFHVQAFLDSRGNNRRHSVLIDLGAPATPTRSGPAPEDPLRTWNNLTTALGSTPGALLAPLLDAVGQPSTLALQVEERFNAANSSGTTANKSYPARATIDSLFGNTEAFGGLADVHPVLLLSGFPPDATVTLTFFASRLFAADNRETLYLVEGAITASASLDASNNDSRTASIAALRPDAQGRLRIRLKPGPANTNPNHFTYLGVLHVEWSAPLPAPRLSLTLSSAPATPLLTLRAFDLPGIPTRLESSSNLQDWSLEGLLPANPEAALPLTNRHLNRFFRISPESAPAPGPGSHPGKSGQRTPR